MGDISEMRGLLFIGTIIVAFTLLLMWMPVDLYSASITEPTTPFFNPGNALSWNGTYTFNMTSDMDESTVILNRNVRLEVQSGPWHNYTFLSTYDYWWLFVYNRYYFSWYQNGIEQSLQVWDTQGLDATLIDANYWADNNTGLKYSVDNTLVQYEVAFSFNTSDYYQPSEALAAGELHLTIFYDFDDRTTSINAINIIGMLFTGQVPGVDPYINALIAVALWLTSGYLVFIFALRIVGAVFGGGGA